MKKALFLISLICAVILLNSCSPDDNRNDNGITDEEFRENFGSGVSRDFIGQVVDTDNNPIQNATVAIGVSSAQTDQNGVFIINGASVHQKFAYIKVSKAGYIDGSRAMVPTSGKNNVKIMLLQSGALETIQSGEESEVSIYSGTKVKFDGAFEDEAGIPYSGGVDVFMFHLAPSNENISNIQPGMLYAETDSGEEAVLQTFGMMNVELRGSGGQKLQIAQGHKAEIAMRIDDDQQLSAPAAIPLWHFDEVAGWWKEEGSATKQGNYYVGEVSHFSWWNCDAPFPTVSLAINLVDVDGIPISGLISLNFAGFPRANAQTNELGQAVGMIPSGEALNVTVYNICGQPIYTTIIGPYTQDSAIGITVPDGDYFSSLVQGHIQDCGNNDVTNGYVRINYGNESHVIPVTSGDFAFSLIACADVIDFTLQGVDFETNQQTGILNYILQEEITNIGILQACTGISEFISLQIDDQPVVYFTDSLTGRYNWDTAQNPNPGAIYVQGDNITANRTIYIGSGGNAPPGSTYASPVFRLGGTQITPILQNITFQFSYMGAVGDYIDISFFGTYADSQGATHNVNGMAHVMRDE